MSSTRLIAEHQLEGGKDQFTVTGLKSSTVAPGVEFQTDEKTAAELLACGAARDANQPKMRLYSESFKEVSELSGSSSLVMFAVASVALDAETGMRAVYIPARQAFPVDATKFDRLKAAGLVSEFDPLSPVPLWAPREMAHLIQPVYEANGGAVFATANSRWFVTSAQREKVQTEPAKRVDVVL